MTDLTSLTLAAALDGMEKKQFSSVELTEAFIGAIDKANPHLNAYVVTTPDLARARAKESDAKRAAGKAGPLEGAPLGIKDLFCTEGVRTTACSGVLGEFTPTYESTVTENLFRDGALMLGKLNMDEFAMGSSNETSKFGPVVSPWRRGNE
jgi:aspartyl-tRNA(Asn)/glutamyl-tRNA(Gln) amidotransferase subunit A